MTAGAAFVSTRRFYESLYVLKQFIILKDFKVANFKNWLTFEFPQNYEVIDYLRNQTLFNLNSSLGTVLSVSHNDAIFDLPYRMSKRIEKLKSLQGNQKAIDEAEKHKCDNYVYITEGILRNLKSSDKLIYNKSIFRLSTNFSTLQEEYLGYSFNDPLNLMICFNREVDAPEFERLEFLGDAVIESMSLYFARKVLLRLGLSSYPELLHSIKVIALSNLGLANLLIFHGLHRFIKFPPDIRDKAHDYINKKSFNTHCKDASLRELEACPKFLGDTMEALCGAIFVDGGWKALIDFFGRIASPVIYFVCKYFDETVVDLIHDITAFFTSRGRFCLRRY